MKIAIIGASGFVGSVLVSEALTRGHTVTGFARNPEKLPKQQGLSPRRVNVFDTLELSTLLKGHDVVISAFTPSYENVDAEVAKRQQLQGVQSIIAATKQANIKRFLVVGGAGSLKTASGEDLVETTSFPNEWKEMARGMRDVLKLLREENALTWTFLSPSAMLQPGKRTGHFRLGQDQLLLDANGESKISLEDYAVAMFDEIENPKHINKRFTVGY